MRPFLLLVLAGYCLPCSGQTPPSPRNEAPPDAVTFRTGATQVRVDVQVIDRGKPVTGLTRDDFRLLDEDTVQPISYFGRESEPLQVVLLLDVSGSMSKMLRDMAAVGQKALGTLQPDDQVAIMLFTRNTKLGLEFTTDKAGAARLLRDAPFEHGMGSGSAINVALLESAQYMKESGPFAGRRAIVILTDNGSLSYQTPDETVLQTLADVNAVVNAIVPDNTKPPAPVRDMTGRNPDFAPHDVFKMSRLSGGEVLKADKAGEKFEQIMGHLRLRYTLAFAPPAGLAPGAYRRLTVELAPAARTRYPKAEVRARAGYFAPKPE